MSPSLGAVDAETIERLQTDLTRTRAELKSREDQLTALDQVIGQLPTAEPVKVLTKKAIRLFIAGRR